MFRSASTLQFQITSRLIKSAGIGEQIGWIDAKRFAEVRAAHAAAAGLKLIKVHVCTDPIAAEFLQGNAIGIYIFRDIRDVYASMMKQRQKPFRFLWHEGFLETCLENFKTWTSLPNVLVSEYEQVMADLAVEVRRIADHLGIAVSPEQCEAIAAEHTLTAQQARIQQFRAQLLQTPLDPNDHREIVDYHDEATLLHMNHIDSAQVDRWKHDLSAAEADQIEARVRQWCQAAECEASVFLKEIRLLG